MKFVLQPPFVHDKDAEGKVLTFFSFWGMHFKFINAKAPQSTHVWCLLIYLFIDDSNDDSDLYNAFMGSTYSVLRLIG